MSPLFIGLIFSFGFFIESIFGFGGSLVAFAILGFFVDIKDLILIALFIASTASIFIIASDFKSFKKDIFFKSLPYCLIGTIIGALVFIRVSSQILLNLFGIFLIILSFKNLFFDKNITSKIVSRIILVIGGFSQGVFGIGGPFFVTALKDQFNNKSELRATVASFFIAYNAVRFFQFSKNEDFNANIFINYWWVPFTLIIAIYLGHKVHLRISEDVFKKMISILILASGISFLIKS